MSSVLGLEADLAWSHDHVISHFPVTVGLAQEVGLCDSSFTAMVFVYQSAPDARDATIFGSDKDPDWCPTSNEDLWFCLNYVGNLQMKFGKDWLASGGFCRPCKWEHIAFVYDKATSNQMIVLNGREIYSSISAGKTSAAYTGKHVVKLGQGSTSPGSTGSWCGSMKQARIYRKAFSAQEIASIAGIVPSSPLSVPLLLESHPGQALVLAQGRGDCDGEEVQLSARLGPACDAISVTFEAGCIRLADRPELALSIGENSDCFTGSQHGRRLVFTRWHGEVAQSFKINYDGTISAGFQGACKGLVIGLQPEGDEDDYDYEPEGTEKNGEEPGTLILVKHLFGCAALKFQIPDVALSCFPIGVPKPSKDMVLSHLISHPGKELTAGNSDYEEIPPMLGMDTRDSNERSECDELPLQLAFDGQSIRPVRSPGLDLLAFTTQTYYDNENNECHDVKLTYYNVFDVSQKFKVNGDGTISARHAPGLVVGLTSHRSGIGGALVLVPEGHDDALVFEELVRSYVVTVAAGVTSAELVPVSCLDLSGKVILSLVMSPWETLGVLRRRCAEEAGVLEVSIKLTTSDGNILASDNESISQLLKLPTSTP